MGIFFVIALQAGRVRPNDVMTMELVLDATAGQITNQYGVIINQVGSKVAANLKTNETMFATIRAKLLGTLEKDRRTNNIHVIEDLRELSEADNATLDASRTRDLV